MDPGDQMLSQKLLVDVGVSTFASENHSHHFFRPLAVTSGHLKDDAPNGAGARAGLRKRSVPRKACSAELVAGDDKCKLTATHRRPTFIPSLGQPPSGFY